jgi:hypothetical protein
LPKQLHSSLPFAAAHPGNRATNHDRWPGGESREKIGRGLEIGQNAADMTTFLPHLGISLSPDSLR